MTEAEWLGTANLNEMVDWSEKHVTRRKQLLFRAACIRLVWPFLEDVRSRRAAEILERCADEEISDQIRQATLSDAAAAMAAATNSLAYDAARVAEAACLPFFMDGPMVAASVLAESQGADALQPSTEWDHRIWEAVEQLKNLLHDIFGNPFRPVAVNFAWCTATVTSLAEAIYAERAFDRLPILADALEDAGCTSSDILDHCRGPGPHARGCWVVDLVLGKE